VRDKCRIGAVLRCVRNGNRLDRDSGSHSIVQKMPPVEQRACLVTTCDRPECLDDGVLAARDGGHAVWYTPEFGTMKERLLKRFEEEVALLERELKTELPKEIQRARELGDLRENAEYQAAKERQTYVQARIAMLKRRMNEIALMNLDRIPHGKAGFGSTVTLREQGNELVYQLVMPEDADAEKGLISTSSPIGKAILNKEEGDAVVVTTPAGTRRFEILKLVTIHE
jgi:transcription elongation factor GreA